MENVVAPSVRAQFEALLLEPLMQPLESAFGDYGQIAAQSFAQAVSKAFASSSSW